MRPEETLHATELDNVGLSAEEGLNLLNQMLEIRGFEDEVQRLFTRNLVRGSTHLCQGQEAVAVGACSALRPGDTMTCTYRGHGAVLAMGASLEGAMAEILGKAEGLCGGKGGSMHLTDLSVGALGSFAVVGAHLPFTAGTALAATYKGTNNVSLAFFGDGATNIGTFHEALNLAAIWRLPAIFVCENNLYGEYTPIAVTTPVERLCDRAASYAMPAEQIDGNDVLEVRRAVLVAAERARAGEGPTFIEAMTYRQKGHSRADPAKYRPPGELERWLKRDPIVLFEQKLLQWRVVSKEHLERAHVQAEQRVREATNTVLEWADPDPESDLPAAHSKSESSINRSTVRVIDAHPRVETSESTGTMETTYRQAVARALVDEMESDEEVILLGEDVAAAGGVFKATEGLYERFGGDRVRDTPISEQAIVGCALGAAVSGLRPVAEIMFADFAGICYDQIANQVAKYSYFADGKASVPVTVRFASGAGLGFAAQHSHAAENWFLNIPGLKICVPGTPADVYGLLRAAIQDDDPVLFFEHKALYSRQGSFREEVVPLGVASVVREGNDVTLVATQLMREGAIAAADQLASEGISVEVIDPRTLVPLDLETLLKSVRKTSRLVCVQECPIDGSWGASVVARVVEAGFEALDARPRVVCAHESPIPFAAPLEAAWMPSERSIAEAVRGVVEE